jgi:hypothetical protein
MTRVSHRRSNIDQPASPDIVPVCAFEKQRQLARWSASSNLPSVTAFLESLQASPWGSSSINGLGLHHHRSGSRLRGLAALGHDHDRGPAPAAARLAGAISISSWVLVILLGRLISFALQGD